MGEQVWTESGTTVFYATLRPPIKTEERNQGNQDKEEV